MKHLILYEIVAGTYNVLSTPWTHKEIQDIIDTNSNKPKWKIIAEAIDREDAVTIANLLNATV